MDHKLRPVSFNDHKFIISLEEFCTANIGETRMAVRTEEAEDYTLRPWHVTYSKPKCLSERKKIE